MGGSAHQRGGSYAAWHIRDHASRGYGRQRAPATRRRRGASDAHGSEEGAARTAAGQTGSAGAALVGGPSERERHDGSTVTVVSRERRDESSPPASDPFSMCCGTLGQIKLVNLTIFHSYDLYQDVFKLQSIFLHLH